jgi:hypothetical protein
VELSDDTVRFGAFVLAHCAAIAATNEPGDLICPFAVFTENGHRRSVDFESQTQDEAVAKGWIHFEQVAENVEYWALGREGFYNFADGRADVLVVTAWKQGMESAFTLLHRFRPTSTGAFQLVGSTELLINGVLFTQPDHPFLTKAIQEGIASHPKGALWETWIGA